MENAATGNPMFSMLALYAVIFAVIYLIMIRPNRKRMEEYKKMLAGLKVGNKIMFAGGIYGVIRHIGEESLKVEIADGVIIEVPKSAVADIV